LYESIIDDIDCTTHSTFTPSLDNYLPE